VFAKGKLRLETSRRTWCFFDMDKDEENDALWELLGRARRVEASPYFARRVVGAIRNEQKRPRFSVSLLLRWLIPTAAVAGLVLGWLSYQNQEQDVFDADFNRTADLQSLVSSEDSFLWIEEDSAL
jgi:hypothetical protein